MHTGTSLFLLASERTKELFKFLQEYGYVLSRSEVVNVGNYENILSNEISALLSWMDWVAIHPGRGFIIHYKNNGLNNEPNAEEH